MSEEIKNTALEAEKGHRTAVEIAHDYVENFDILETINNVGNDEVFTPRRICEQMLDSLPEDVWTNPNYKWLNPCTKNGVFEREIALRLDVGLKSVIPDETVRRKHILQDMIFAIGHTKFTSHVARRTLYYCSEANRKCDGEKAKDGHYVNGFAISNGEWFSTSDGNILTPSAEHEFGANGKCKYCGVSKDSKYVDPLQREQYAYEFMHVNHLVLERHLNKRFFGGNKNMKFDIIIGNPPYQLTDGGGGSSARPIYQHFVTQALALNPKYLCMIIPSRWFSGGKGLDDFRKEMINNKHIRILHDFVEAKQCFPSVGLEGGVCFFVYNKEEEGKCHVFTHYSSGEVKESERYLCDDSTIDILIRDEKALSILGKVMAVKWTPFSSIVSPRNPFGVSNLESYISSKNSGKYRIFGRFDNQRSVKFLNEHFSPSKNNNLIDKWKIFVSKADGAAGQIGNPIPARILGKGEIGEPNMLCSETFLCIGPVQNKEEAENIISFMKTKFFRFMLGIRKNKNMTRDTYNYVPLMDVTRKWTDTDLYSFFKLSPDDVEYIEKMISGMK